MNPTCVLEGSAPSAPTPHLTDLAHSFLLTPLQCHFAPRSKTFAHPHQQHLLRHQETLKPPLPPWPACLSPRSLLRRQLERQLEQSISESRWIAPESWIPVWSSWRTEHFYLNGSLKKVPLLCFVPGLKDLMHLASNMPYHHKPITVCLSP